MGIVASTPSMSDTTSEFGKSQSEPSVTPKAGEEIPNISCPGKPTTPTERVLVRQPDETEEEYKIRSRRFSDILAGLGLKPDNLMSSEYAYFGESIYGIDEYSIPSPKWNTIQCICWIKLYLYFETLMSKKDATAMACKFKETGVCLVRMEKEDWRTMFKENGNGWMSLWARMEKIKEKGLIGKEDIVEEEIPNEEGQEGEDAWADELLDLSTTEKVSASAN